jgi:iron complex outermembrane receptor protein
MKKLFYFIILLLATFAAASSAHPCACKRPNCSCPAPAAKKARLPEVLVQDKKQPATLTAPSPETAAERLNRVAGGVNLLKADDYKRARVANIKDALDFAPGVYIQPRFGSDESRLSIRGSGLQRTFHGRGLFLSQDGVPLNLADGGFDFQAVEPLATSYIEIFRGANALQYGAQTLGGSINFISPTGYTSSPLQTRAEAGSFGYLRGQLSSSLAEGPADYYASLTYYSRDGFQDHSHQSTQRVFANVGLQIDPQLETRFFLTYTQTDSELPGSLTKAQLEADPTQAARTVPGFFTDRFDNMRSNWKRDFELIRLSNKTVYSWDNQRLEAGLFWSYKDLDHPILFVIDQLSNDMGAQLRYVNENDFLGNKNILTVGLNTAVGQTEDNRFINNLGNRGRKFYDADLLAANIDLYAENQHYVLDKLALIAGAQFSYANRDMRETLPLPRRDYQDYYGFSPKLGARYEVTPTTQLFANVSRSFEPPSFGELVSGVPAFPETTPVFSGIRNLDAQSATTVEIGSRGREGVFAWDIAFYHAWVDNELLAYQTAPGLTQTLNGTATLHQGIELGFDVTLAEELLAKKTKLEKPDQLTLRQVYNWSNFQFASDPVFGRNALAGLPEHYYRAELRYDHPCGFYIGPNIEWVITKMPVDFAHTWFADPFALVGVRVGYQTRHGLGIFFEAKNLTDQTYAATTNVVPNAAGRDTNAFLPGDGRAFYGGVEWKW